MSPLLLGQDQGDLSPLVIHVEGVGNEEAAQRVAAVLDEMDGVTAPDPPPIEARWKVWVDRDMVRYIDPIRRLEGAGFEAWALSPVGIDLAVEGIESRDCLTAALDALQGLHGFREARIVREPGSLRIWVERDAVDLRGIRHAVRGCNAPGRLVSAVGSHREVVFPITDPKYGIDTLDDALESVRGIAGLRLDIAKESTEIVVTVQRGTLTNDEVREILAEKGVPLGD